jgi:two-component system, NtrC family, sensor kinase
MKNVFYLLEVIFPAMRKLSTLLVKTINDTHIPQKVVDKIFQPFFTTRPTGQGTGLGLSLAYDIVTKEHGGELKVESKEGEFAEFVIQLPGYR